MRIIGSLLLFSAGFASLPALGGQLPPLGQRVYLLDSTAPARPVDIRPLERGSSVPGQSAMRDPLPIGSTNPVDRSQGPKPSDAPRRISRMVFDKVSVAGRYLVPRVTFDRPSMDIGRQEEPVKVEYKKKILESERELREFDW